MAKVRHHNLDLILGTICLGYWLLNLLDALVNHRPSWLLWYSSAGLFTTGIALLTENTLLIYSAFCALFAMEGLWTIDFLYAILVKKSLLGFTAYAFAPSFGRKDFFMTLYHILIPISLLTAILNNPKANKYGWLGAIVFVSILGFLTYFLVGPNDRVNCIHSLSSCQSVFTFLYKIQNPYRIFVALLGLVIFVYVPSNYLVITLKKKQTKNKS